MRPRNIQRAQANLPFTALALWGTWATASLALPSCAATPSSGAGGAAGTNRGGSGGNGSGGGGGNHGDGGNGGAGTGGGGSSQPSGSDEVRFAQGQASGPLDGKAFVALGIQNAVSDPVCDNSDRGGSDRDPITKDKPCDGTTRWNDDASLCLSGSIPKVVDGDYDSNFGLQIMVNSSEPAYSDSAGHSLSKSYTDVTFHYDQGTITPTLASSLLRVLIHKGGDDAESVYCAIATGSGNAIALTSFNSECWPGGRGEDFAAADIPKIDKVGIQISSDEKQAYDVQRFCLEKIIFGD